MTLSEAIQSSSDADYIEDEGGKYDGEDFENLSISFSSFSSASFSSAVFRGAVFTDVVFDSCDFSNADFSSASFHSVKFLSCRFTGSVFLSARLKKVEIDNATGLYTSFDNAFFSNCCIMHSDFRDSSFSSISHTKLEITDTNLSRASLRGTRLSGLSLRGTTLDGITLSENMKELKGALLDISQALAIIRTKGADIN